MNRAAIAIIALVFGAVGCDWFDDPRPNEARLVVQGDAGKQVRVITSTRFISAVNEAGETRVVLLQADTVFTSLPIDKVYTIGGERFFAEAARLDTDFQTVRMQVYLDRAKRFDEDGPLIEGQPYRFVYTFNQTATREIIVL